MTNCLFNFQPFKFCCCCCCCCYKYFADTIESKNRVNFSGWLYWLTLKSFSVNKALFSGFQEHIKNMNKNHWLWRLSHEYCIVIKKSWRCLSLEKLLSLLSKIFMDFYFFSCYDISISYV